MRDFARTGRLVCPLTRRGFLGAAVGAVSLALGENRIYPPERVRYPDPATEFEVFRLTDPGHASFLPPARNRIFNRRGSFLLYAAERAGTVDAYTLDLKSWQSRQVTEGATKLEVDSLHLTPDDRNVVYVDSGAVMVAPLSGGRAREVYRMEAGGGGLALGVSVTLDGPSVLVAEPGGRLRMIPVAGGGRSSPTVRTVAENSDGVRWPVARPRRASVAYLSQDSLWLAAFGGGAGAGGGGSRGVKLKTSPGRVGGFTWAPDGRTLYYLSFPEGVGKSYQLRENNPDTGEDKLVAPTSQFVAFSANSDASVFVGASGSKAGPYVLLLLRLARRELTLCEHKTTDPVSAAPVFSPDSQKIFFQSDRHGKPAIYSMVVEKLVEKTEDEAEDDRPVRPSPPGGPATSSRKL